MVFRRKALLRALMIADVVIVASCFAATVATARLPLTSSFVRHFLELRVSVLNALLFVGLVTAWHTICLAHGFYDSRRASTLRRDTFSIILATFSCVAVTGLWAALFRVDVVSLPLLGVFALYATTGLVLSRAVLRFALRRIRKRGRNLRQVLIVGTNERARKLANVMRARPDLGYVVAGFVDDPWPGVDGVPEDCPIVASLGEFREYVRHRVIDEVVMCLPMRSYYHEASEIVRDCGEQGITTRFQGDLFGLAKGSSGSSELQSDSMVTVFTLAQRGWASVVKRGFDFVVALALLILMAPVLLVIAVLVKLTSPGEVIFSQERIGLNKRRFQMFKFRSMSSGSEQKLSALEEYNEASGPVFKIKDDPRCTRLGKFLRRTSLDELPQLWNVVRGDMSLVGPRPLPERDWSGFTKDWHRCRFSVRPGITCLWQVSGRSLMPFEEWMKLDREYIENWTLWMDLKILVRTVPVVLAGTGAA